jgi:cyclohexanone monooxygenase
MNTEMPERSQTFDAIVVGAGFAGLYMLHKLRQMGLRARVIEAGDGVGGTWYWNRYPGARCDVESMQYSYSFDEALQQEWVWSERYPAQKEILAYINHVADRFDLRRDIQLSTRVVGADWHAGSGTWQVRTDQEEQFTSRFLITAVGCLSAARTPDLEGLESFSGLQLHTSNWPAEGVDLRGKKVGVIGTGSSGIQVIPQLARQAAQLVVFQRTPNFSIPAWNRPLPVSEQNDWKQHYAEHRDRARQTRSGILYEYSQRATFDVAETERQAEYERRWQRGGANFTHAFNDIFTNREANDQLAEFVRHKIRDIVKDPQMAERLTPRDHAIGTKRICVDTDYYATYNLPQVRLHDLRSAKIQRFTATGVQTEQSHYELDAIVFATGFDAVTGSIERMSIRGEGGRPLNGCWQDGPRTYLGLATAGFPNLFFITGPGSPSILTNVIVSIEQHVQWIADCLAGMQAQGHTHVQAREEAQNGWVRQVAELAKGTLFTTTASWYMGANVPGKPRVFLPYGGGFANYTRICNEEMAAAYPGFIFSGTKD